MRKVAWVAVLLLAGCSAEAPVEPLQTEAAPTHSQEQYEGLEGVVAKIEEATNTEVGVALYDGTTLTQAGSLDTLPAWSTIKIPIARAAERHCEYDHATIADFTQASIEWSDNDSARALWDCMGDDLEAAKRVGEEIEKAGPHVNVRGAFGTTSWTFADQAKYAHYLSTRDQSQPVLADMRNITEDQAYGLGQLGVPFKGGWSDVEEDGSWHTRQLGWIKHVGVAIGARSADGSYEDTMDALDQVAEAIAP
ncbi:hypothetical protein CYJ46_04435 [Corynebacterium coyleae]|uniref:hypothetical protein n=1 Tax=Corynebacterium coyleae TaxID=53374 RepID=UPI000C7808CF|nr:hypothetical protein [Corynebacterium coyleae]PLA38324.1 hypothetical protein CYJ46_04435 [Corynebacterium coyleae]